MKQPYWSRYLDQMETCYGENFERGWVAKVRELQALFECGEQIDQMTRVTAEDFVTEQQALFDDMVFLQWISPLKVVHQLG